MEFEIIKKGLGLVSLAGKTLRVFDQIFCNKIKRDVQWKKYQKIQK